VISTEGLWVSPETRNGLEVSSARSSGAEVFGDNPPHQIGHTHSLALRQGLQGFVLPAFQQDLRAQIRTHGTPPLMM
jgi:hypothetical protein